MLLKDNGCLSCKGISHQADVPDHCIRSQRIICPPHVAEREHMVHCVCVQDVAGSSPECSVISAVHAATESSANAPIMISLACAASCLQLLFGQLAMACLPPEGFHACNDRA